MNYKTCIKKIKVIFAKNHYFMSLSIAVALKCRFMHSSQRHKTATKAAVAERN